MLTSAENNLLTEIEPGTRMGSLLRRYWQPLGAVWEMQERWTKRVRLFGENLVLYKDRSGAFGLIAVFLGKASMTILVLGLLLAGIEAVIREFDAAWRLAVGAVLTSIVFGVIGFVFSIWEM